MSCPRILAAGLVAASSLAPAWSEETPRRPFIRGEANADGRTDISDAVSLLGCLFLGTRCPTCADAGDVDDDGRTDITDPIYLLDHLFQGGPGPPVPRGFCGIDDTPDELGCEEFTPCRVAEIPRGADRLLVERFSRGGERSFYTMELDGSLVAPFGGVPADARSLVPSPDGLAIAYLRLTDDLVHLWVMDRYGAGRRPILEGVRVIEHVAWSPDGSRFAIEQSTLTEASDIWIVDLEGGGAVNLTPDPLPGIIFDRSPCWSPGGDRIAFSSNRTGTTRLWTMKPDGTDVVQTVPSSIPGAEFAPTWSPDGARIAFRALTPEGNAVGVVEPDGEGYRTFPVRGDASPPVWAANGKVLFTSNTEGNFEVYALDLASGEPANLTLSKDHDLRVAPFRHVPPDPWLGPGAPDVYALTRPDPPAIGAGDVNADGLEDLIVLSPSISAVSILIGRPGARFEPLGGLEAGTDQRAVVIADVSRDGADDIVVLGPGELSVWRGGPQGPGLARTHPFGGDGRGLAASDFDGDGSTDVAAIHDGGDVGLRMRVFGATPDGERDLVAILDYSAEFGAPGRACDCDATGDGLRDILVTTADPAAPVVLLPGQGDISFGVALAASDDVPPGLESILLCEDLNGDRRADLALLLPGDPGGLTILHSTGNGLEPAQELALRASAIAAADADRDGDIDIFLAGSEPAGLVHLRNQGDGRFAAPVVFSLGDAPLRILAADLDGDAWPDLVTTAGAQLEVRRSLGR